MVSELENPHVERMAENAIALRDATAKPATGDEIVDHGIALLDHEGKSIRHFMLFRELGRTLCGLSLGDSEPHVDRTCGVCSAEMTRIRIERLSVTKRR